MRGRFALERLLPFACLGGAILLVISQFMTLFELNSAGPSAEALVDSADQHWYAMTILGVFAVLATVAAVGAGSKPMAVSVAVAGAAALVLFLLIDLPDAGKTGNISDPVRSFVTVEADPQMGFWIELLGALVLTVCGAALATLTPDQLRSLGPRKRGEDRPSRGEGSQPNSKRPRKPSLATQRGQRSERTSERT